MDSSLAKNNNNNNGVAILQLLKWQAQLNLSEFRQAFISPTRHLLLLLSYHCEALLVPLLSGSEIFESNSDESSKIRADLSGRSVVGDSLSSKIGDVDSLAWGACEDSYDQHTGGLFREVLFVCGKQGLTAHAFVESTQNTEVSSNAVEAKGRWVEWGHLASTIESMEVEEEATRLSSEANGHGESQDKSSVDGVGELSKSVASKRWLHSFLTEVENVDYKGNTLTRFPEKSLLPCSAKVVSFSLFNSSLPVLGLLSKSATDKECFQEKVRESKSDTSMSLDIISSHQHFESEILSNIFGVGLHSLYKCSRVFSSSSHHLIGFVFTLVDLEIINASDESGRSKENNVLLIARLDNLGIHWISSVKLDESPNIGSVAQWTDFHFSDNLLVCLDASGLVVFYAAMSGEYVAHIDILQALGHNPQLELQKQVALSEGYNKHLIQVDGIHSKIVSQHVGYSGRRVFKRLISASHTSLVAAIDDYGVIYVISACEFPPDNLYKNEKLLPYIQHLELGMLPGWEVGGSEIGYQRDISGSWNSITPSMTKGGLFLDDYVKKKLQRNQEVCLKREGNGYNISLSGFVTSSKVTNKKFDDPDKKSHLMRKIFLPSYKFTEDDTICFSPLGITRLMKNQCLEDQRGSLIVHLNLHAESAARDDSFVNTGIKKFNLQGMEESSIEEAVACTFQGCFYLVTEDGLSVVLPSISVSSNFLLVEVIGCRQLCVNSGIGYQVDDVRDSKKSKQHSPPWNLEVIDRVLLCENAEEADRLCVENGWDLKIFRMRRLQLSLEYMKFDEIERSLEKLVGVNLAEEGVLSLLFATVYLMLHKADNDNDVSAVSRLLALATCFASKMIRKYWSLEHRKDAYDSGRTLILSLPPISPVKLEDELANSRRLREMTHFLEIIRILQSRLGSKYKRPGQELVDSGDASRLVDNDLVQNESQLSIVSMDSIYLEATKEHETSFPVSTSSFNHTKNLALTPVDSKGPLELENLHEVSALVPQGGITEKKSLPLENPKEMIARWKINNLDLKAVVSDALLSGRLPLAVLQLHLHRSRDSFAGKEPHDTFSEVRDIGRVIAYDLFLKGESGLAVATLQRLGEDVETSFKQLLFGTVRQSLRVQITEEMNRYGYLGSYEWKILG